MWFSRDTSLLDIDLNVWDQVFDINLKSMVHTCRAAVPLDAAVGFGRRHGAFSQPSNGSAATRSRKTPIRPRRPGVCALSKSLAMQLAADGIRSNTILPGMAQTPLQARWDADALKAVADYVPLKRVGTSQDMANAALFLLSDEASYITGIEVAVDGGLLMKL